MKFSARLVGLTFLVGVCFSGTAQSHGETPPVPAPTPGIRPLQNYAIATITLPGAQPATSRASDGRFEMVAIRFHETAEIDVQFPSNPTTTAPSVQALDGGIITGSMNTKTAGTGGVTSFRFHAPGKPGLYRILIAGSTGPFMLPFWIADPGNPENRRPVVNPTH
jgi:hypothetical protein